MLNQPFTPPAAETTDAPLTITIRKTGRVVTLDHLDVVTSFAHIANRDEMRPLVWSMVAFALFPDGPERV